MSTPADDRRTAARTPGQGTGQATGQQPAPARTAIRRLVPLIVIVALVALAYGLGLHRDISFETLVRNRTAIDIPREPA